MPSVLTRTLLIAFAAARTALAATYHFDSAGGNDQHDGLTPATAWRSLEKFNGTVFQPDDRALFKSGQEWKGQLRPRGSGSLTGDRKRPVVMGRYGEGGLPRIHGEGRFDATLLVQDVEFWEIGDLAITNQGVKPAPGRSGVTILAEELRVMRGITLRGLHVHDVNGDLRKSHEGQGIFFEASKKNGSIFDGILIENCRLERTDRNGICQRGLGNARSKNVIIRNNVLEDIGGDAIKLWGTNGGLIERNIVRNARARCSDHAAGIWPFACDDTIIQYNVVTGTKGTTDGQAFDADYMCKRTIIQNNYSSGNEGGFILICSPGNSYNIDTIVRNNVSVHDGINSARVIQIGGNPSNTHFTGNTIVIGEHQDIPLVSFNEWDGGNALDTRFTNNLLIVSGKGRATYVLDGSKNTRFSNNFFVGRHDSLPADARDDFFPSLSAVMPSAPGETRLPAGIVPPAMLEKAGATPGTAE